MCFSACLRQGTRYPFVPKVFPSAKQSRCILRKGRRYESLTSTNAAIARARTGPEQAADAANPCPRTVRSRVQSMPAGAAATVRIPEPTSDIAVRGQALAMGANRSQTVRSLALSTSTISPLTNIGRKPRQAKHYPSRRIAVFMSPPTSFPVHIRNIPAHVLI